MRSLLFVPGHDERKLTKGLGCGADALILDLEDAVPPAQKTRAREVTAAFVAAHRDLPLFVRVNSLESGLLHDDLAAVIGAKPYGIMLPKCEGGQDLVKLEDCLADLEAKENIEIGTTRILPVVTESAAAVLNLSSYPRQENGRLWGMLWGGEDLATDMGVPANRSETGQYTALFQMVRSMTLLTAAAARVTAVDAVYTNFRDAQGLRAEAEQARRDGFMAKAAIHPDQIAIINEVFQVSSTELHHARQVVAAFEAEPQAGSVSIEGRMYDRPHLLAACRLLKMATGEIE
ncbi:HpcH/HpaI aldolase/citrate lyase family protein [Advenella mimigardefordensis]|uniref:Putative citrate lyase subunit beta n=1 Tax=Advenella mimigardefordensis (strain DSM 17166 / LMG 22922 / DPN7) TaxID=1247726 RepID=W0PDI1_ADVMD|nr:CoA ester lyase [Advenella mimigardefordensis]AHG63475.1 putative citrate lyase subunit beta [Advenella mimigardefordensis DPN7]